MNPFKTTLTCIILVVAAGLIYISQSGSLTPTPGQVKLVTRPVMTQAGEISTSRDSKPAARVAPLVLDLSVTSDDPAQQAACSKVEWTARRRLENLDEVLKLTKVQQQRIFPILVRGSAGYSPAMKAGGQALGDATQSMEDAICAEIDPSRQVIYQEMLIDDADWWNAAAKQLESALDEPEIQSTSLPSPVQ